MSALTKIYEELSIERAHVCTGCGSQAMLSHSHIVPRSQEKSLETVKGNITFHCNSCHYSWDHSHLRVFMKDFKVNMVYMYNNAQSFYWLRMFKMQQYWQTELDFPEGSQERLRVATNALGILNALALVIQAIEKVK